MASKVRSIDGVRTSVADFRFSEAWRYEGAFTRWNRFSGAFPGLGIATVAFTGYCLYEHFFMESDHHGHAVEGHGDGHGEGHGEGHH